MHASNIENSIKIKKKKPLKIYNVKRALIPWLFLIPGLFFTILLRYYTIFQGLKLAFYKYNLADPPGDFIGFKNFEYLFKNKAYWTAWYNSFVFFGLIIGLNFFIPLIEALLLAEIVKLRSFFSTLYILPAVIPLTVNVLLWRWIYDPSYGIANRIITIFGGKPMLWLSDVHMVKFCIILPGVVGGGLGVLLYLAAILGVSEDIKEAAQIDGCAGFKRLFYITLPNIKFMIFIQLLLTTMGAFQLLDLPFQYTNGGPGDAAQTVSVLIYHLFTRNFDYGQASAASIPLLLVICIITFIQLRLNKEEKV
ncbi:MAG TPA: sugar ABC transporter permease [Ruminiclostridium sp.]